MTSRDLQRLAAGIDLFGWTVSLLIVTGVPDPTIALVSLVLRALLDLLPVRYAWTTWLATLMRAVSVILLAAASIEHPARVLPAALILIALIVGAQGWRTSREVTLPAHR